MSTELRETAAERRLRQDRARMRENLTAGQPLPDIAGDRPLPPHGGRQQGYRFDRDAGYLALSRIVPDPRNVRGDIDTTSPDFQDFVQEIRQRGLKQAVDVYYDEEADLYRLVMGHRRYFAARAAGLEAIRVTIRATAPTEAEIRADQIVENLHRENLTPMAEARGLQAIKELHGFATNAELARFLNLKEMRVSDALALLNLPDEVQEKTDQGLLSKTVASSLARQVGSPEQVRALADQISDRGLNKQQARELIREQTDRVQARARRASPDREPQAKPGRPSTRETVQTPRGTRVVFTFRKKKVTDADRAEALAACAAKFGISATFVEPAEPSAA